MSEKGEAIALAPQPSVSSQDASKPIAVNSHDGGAEDGSSKPWIAVVYDRLAYVPPRCRYDPEKPFKFNIGINILFGEGHDDKDCQQY